MASLSVAWPMLMVHPFQHYRLVCRVPWLLLGRDRCPCCCPRTQAIICSTPGLLIACGVVCTQPLNSSKLPAIERRLVRLSYDAPPSVPTNTQWLRPACGGTIQVTSIV